VSLVTWFEDDNSALKALFGLAMFLYSEPSVSCTELKSGMVNSLELLLETWSKLLASFSPEKSKID